MGFGRREIKICVSSIVRPPPSPINHCVGRVHVWSEGLPSLVVPHCCRQLRVRRRDNGMIRDAYRNRRIYSGVSEVENKEVRCSFVEIRVKCTGGWGGGA
jgi:hypothetical protein